MILQLTYNGQVQNLDSDIVLYGYYDSGLKIIINQIGITYTPATTVFEANAIQAISSPSYATFAAGTADAGFFEATHATLTTVCVNANRINKLEVIDSSNTKIYFNYNQTLDVNESMSALTALINAALTPTSGGGGSTFTSVVVDTGTTPVYQKTVNVIDASATALKQVVAMQGQQATTAENSGEEPILLHGVAKAGSIDFTICNAIQNHLIKGTFKINYSLI